MDSNLEVDLSTVFRARVGLDVTEPSAQPQHISFVDVGGVGLRLSVMGQGPPLLFLFGSGAGATIENAQQFLVPLSRKFTVACHDQRGLGLSDVPPGPWTMADYASDAFGVADHLGWTRFSAVGLSFGGMVALEMAATHPHRFERLVLLGTSPGGSAPSYPLHELGKLSDRERFWVFPEILDIRLEGRDRGRLEFVHAVIWRIREFLRPFVRRIRRIDKVVKAENERRERGLALQLEARRGHDVMCRLGQIESPTFIGAGTFDGLAPVRNAEILRREIRHSELHIYEFGHLFFCTEPEVFDDSLEFLLGEQSGDPGTSTGYRASSPAAVDGGTPGPIGVSAV